MCTKFHYRRPSQSEKKTGGHHGPPLVLRSPFYPSINRVKKAFDSVWHKGLFHTAIKNGINGNTLNLIKQKNKAKKQSVLSK